MPKWRYGWVAGKVRKPICRPVNAEYSASIWRHPCFRASMANPFFLPSRNFALSGLAQFAPKAGHLYASGRNTDTGPDQLGAVSRLSPYVRRRLITEREIVAAVLARHSLEAAGKFVQEVLWRTYWKGWLEMRPAVWARFLEERERQRDAFSDRRAISDAESGQTGIEGFDDWSRELVERAICTIMRGCGSVRSGYSRFVCPGRWAPISSSAI